MPRRGLLLLAAGIWLGAALPLRAQWPEVEASLDTSRLTLGDPLHLRLRLRHLPDQRPLPPRVAERLRDFKVQPAGVQGPTPVDGGMETVLDYEVRSYALGAQRIPSLVLRFVAAAGDTLVRRTRALDFEVLSARREGEDQPRDIKPPLLVPGGVPLWVAALLGGLLLLGIAAALLWWWKRPRQRRQPEAAPRPVDYMAEFTRIAGLGLVERGAFKVYYSLLSETLRRFLEESLGVEAMEQTTFELVEALRRAELAEGILGEIASFLNTADLAKFARFVPSPQSARRALEEGRAIVRAVQAFRAKREQRALEAAAET